MTRAEFARDFYLCETASVTDECCRDGAQCIAPLRGKGEEFQVAFAGENYGEEAAVGGDVEFADGDAVEDGLRRGLEDGNFLAGFLCGELGKRDPDQVAGFSFDGAF